MLLTNVSDEVEDVHVLVELIVVEDDNRFLTELREYHEREDDAMVLSWLRHRGWC